jgi:phosphoglycerate dehydrogenase-like enzyme
MGTLVLGGVRSACPDVTVIEAGTPEAAQADVLATLAGEPDDIAGALTPGIRWVHVLGAGIDEFPLAALGDRILTCSRGAAAPAISEFVVAAMLAFEKHLPETWITEPPAAWSNASLGGLEGLTIGIIGLGSIGTEVARRALAFDMDVVAIRRRDQPAPLPGIRLTRDLGELLASSDHVVIAAPATDRTERLIDAAALQRMKPGAHLVNVARGSLVDQDALLIALDEGRLSRATLDVVDPEPLPTGHRLYGHDRVRLSPHVSWSSPRTMRRTMELFVQNVDRYRRGQTLLGIVDPKEGY